MARINASAVAKQKSKMFTWTIFLFASLFVLLVVLFGLRATAYCSNRAVHETIEFNWQLAEVINEIQTERDLRTSYVRNRTEAAEYELIHQHRVSDRVSS